MQDELISLAEKLGQALARHERVRAYYAAQQAAQNDPAARGALRSYQDEAQRLGQLEAQGRPISEADKARLATAEVAMTGSDALKALLRAQTDYVDLMNQVNRAIGAPMLAAQGGSPA